MKRAAALAALALGLGLLPARADVSCPVTRSTDREVPVPNGLVVPDNHVRVLLPKTYDCQRAFPVLYLLHGAGDTYQTWTANTDLVALTGGLDLIVVMPDGGKDSNAGWYSDWKSGVAPPDWETFHIEHVIPFIESEYRTLGQGHRAIAGLSMGGFGAMHYAARHRTSSGAPLFAAAASFSGAVDTMYLAPASGVGFTLFHSTFGTPDDRVWGNQVDDEADWRANNPTDLAASLAGIRLLIATGNGLPGGAHESPANPGGYAIEQFIWQLNLSFVRALDAAQVPHTDLFYGPGQHSWPYWRDDLSWALPQILAVVA